ncbi:MAG: 4Fe-4S binding protein [Candidatus Lernaella stagnicola]|nr:4Fe-4S binding protein [Candidatus Lernaella stagnicola]
MKTTRLIIHIDEEKCDGCGLCVPACEEGALAVVDGKARLVKETYCDGLGECLGECPRGALTVEERPAEAFDAAAVAENLAEQSEELSAETPAPHVDGCPGTLMWQSAPEKNVDTPTDHRASALSHWPLQIRLVSPLAPFLRHADLLLCADCAPFALPDLHERFLAGRVVLVGCPKLDDLAFYRHRLAQVFAAAQPRSITVLRMEVPCCGGIAEAAFAAHRAAGSTASLEVHTVAISGGVARVETIAGREAQTG